MLSPWDPQDSATTWYHSTFHCGEREENLLRLQRIPSVILFLSFFLPWLSNRTAGVWVKVDPLPTVHFNIRRGKEVSPVVRNLCPYTSLASSARPCGILGILADLWVSYFHMDELYPTTSSVYQEPKSVDIENRVFFFLAVLAPLFSREIYFSWLWPWDSCLPLHGGWPWGSDGVSETAAGSMRGLVATAAFWLNIFNLREYLYSWKVFPGYIWAVGLVTKAGSSTLCCQSKDDGTVYGKDFSKRPFDLRGFSLSTPPLVCVGAAWTSQKGPHSCFHTAVSCVGAEWASVFWISSGKIICHITICGHKSEELLGSLKTANGGFMSWLRCALMLFFSSLDIMTAAENIQTWFCSEFGWGR